MASGFFWTETSGADRVLVTSIDIQVMEPGHNQTRLLAESLDGSVLTAIRIGGPQHELAIAIRHEPASKTLDDLKRAFDDKLSVTIVPDVTDQARAFTVKGVGGNGPEREPRTGEPCQLFTMVERVRRLDGGALW